MTLDLEYYDLVKRVMKPEENDTPESLAQALLENAAKLDAARPIKGPNAPTYVDSIKIYIKSSLGIDF